MKPRRHRIHSIAFARAVCQCTEATPSTDWERAHGPVRHHGATTNGDMVELVQPMRCRFCGFTWEEEIHK